MGLILAVIVEFIESSFYELGAITLRSFGVRESSETFAGIVGCIAALALVGCLVFYLSR